VIGTAVAGAAAQRLGTEAGIKETMTATRSPTESARTCFELDSRSVVIFDEAGMADTRRLAEMVELDARRGREARPRRRHGAALVDRRGRPVRRDRGARRRPRS
jgi:hypothetical protein